MADPVTTQPQPMTPPPDYNNVMSGKSDQPPSYDSPLVSRLNLAAESADVPPTQPQDDDDNLMCCERYYDPMKNDFVPCFICNIFCHPCSAIFRFFCGGCLEDTPYRNTHSRSAEQRNVDNSRNQATSGNDCCHDCCDGCCFCCGCDCDGDYSGNTMHFNNDTNNWNNDNTGDDCWGGNDGGGDYGVADSGDNGGDCGDGGGDCGGGGGGSDD